jgi:membrane protein DedA with SNARE-associated domain
MTPFMDPVGTAMAWVATQGLVGLLGLAVFERLIPILPSHGLLVAIGIACAQGHWSLPQAVGTTVAASLAGCIVIYAIGNAIGEARAMAGLRRAAALLHVRPARLERLLARCRAHEAAFGFSSQVVPGVRQLAPGIAGLLQAGPRAFFVGTAKGILVWNALFISVGKLAMQWSGVIRTFTQAGLYVSRGLGSLSVTPKLGCGVTSEAVSVPAIVIGDSPLPTR